MWRNSKFHLMMNDSQQFVKLSAEIFATLRWLFRNEFFLLQLLSRFTNEWFISLHRFFLMLSFGSLPQIGNIAIHRVSWPSQRTKNPKRVEFWCALFSVVFCSVSNPSSSYYQLRSEFRFAKLATDSCWFLRAFIFETRRVKKSFKVPFEKTLATVLSFFDFSFLGSIQV